MADLVGLVIVVFVVGFAIYQVSQHDGPFRKVAVMIVAGLAAVADQVWGFIQQLMGG